MALTLKDENLGVLFLLCNDIYVKKDIFYDSFLVEGTNSWITKSI